MDYHKILDESDTSDESHPKHESATYYGRKEPYPPSYCVKYVTGVNTNPVSRGSISFSREDILSFLPFDSPSEISYLRRVYLPDLSSIEVMSTSPMYWSCPEVILGERIRIDERTIFSLIQEGASIETRNQTLLFWAINNDSIELVEYLVSNGIDANVFNGEALNSAAREGNENIVKYLIDNGANLEYMYGSPLASAVTENHIDVVKTLIANKSDIRAQGNQAFLRACEIGNMDIVRLFISEGVKLSELDSRPFRYAAFYGHIDLLKFFIDESEFNKLYGGEALCGAVSQGNTEIVQILVENGADVNATDYWRGQPLKLAIDNRNEKIILILRNGGAS